MKNSLCDQLSFLLVGHEFSSIHSRLTLARPLHTCWAKKMLSSEGELHSLSHYLVLGVPRKATQDV
ncbi:unnamed protein product, partial [Amoebophrya sp. A120]|eukprot:GSA120T00023489001.1